MKLYKNEKLSENVLGSTNSSYLELLELLGGRGTELNETVNSPINPIKDPFRKLFQSESLSKNSFRKHVYVLLIGLIGLGGGTEFQYDKKSMELIMYRFHH